jgi:thymidylate kinase
LAGNRDMFVHFIQVLEEAGAPYCILAGYDGYPDDIGSDVDFMISAEWAGRLPQLIAGAAARSGGHLIQYLRHETTATYFVIARQDGSSVSYLHPDSSTDYRRGSRRWMQASGVLQRRRRHPQGFWVPAASDAFAYYLIKKIDKGRELDPAQIEQLTRRYLEDPVACSRALRELLPAPDARSIEEAVTSGSWSEIPSLRRLRAALNARAPAEDFGGRFCQALADLQRFADRVFVPTGLHIVFLGPDGSGKSTVISKVCSEMRKAFRRVQPRHLRPGLFTRKQDVAIDVTDPHGRPPRGPLGSIAKLFYFWLDFMLGAVVWLFPRKVRSTLVVFDRYYHDILADPLRYRFSGSIALARSLGRMVPQPDLVFILDGPPAVLQQRKQEITLAEGTRQRVAYLGLRSEFREVRVIDVSQPVEKVVAEVLGHVIACQEARTVRRLGLCTPASTPAIADPAS